MKAKQKIALLLAIFYMVAVTGLAFNLHFCGGTLDSVALFKAPVSCKMCTKMAAFEKENSCCKDTKIEVKVKDNHQISHKTELSKNFEFQLLTTSFIAINLKAVAKERAFQQLDAPPPLNYPSINILHCTFRI